MNKLPLKLVKLRKHYNYSQAYVAKELGIDVFEYMAYENGRRVFSFEKLVKLADFYRIKADELFVNDIDVHLYPVNLKKDNQLNIFKKYYKHLIITVISIFIFCLILIVLPKKHQKQAQEINPHINKLSASNTFIVYLDELNKIKGSGDNSNGQLNLNQIEGVLQVETGATFTVVLKDDFTVKTIGLLSKYAKEIELWKNIVDIKVGKAHVVALTKTGEVYCVGDNFYDQCKFNFSNAQAIFAKENATMVLKDGMVKVFGDFKYTKEIEKIKNIKSLDFNNDVIAYIDNDHKVSYISESNFDVSKWSDVDKVVVGDGFIAALIDNHVEIAIDNYLIVDEVEKWEVEDIASGGDYLVGYHQGKILGVGNNRFNQFEKAEKDLQQLPNVENIKIDLLENDIKIQFDKVRFADYYQVELDAGIGLNIRTDNNYAYIPYLKLKENDEYTIRITAFSKNKNYLKSNTTFFKWTYIKPEPEKKPEKPEDSTVIIIETPFKLESLLGKTVANFEAYLKGLGIPDENITRKQSNQNCSSEQKEAIVVAVSGIVGGEEVKSSELKTRKVEYEYCKIE